MNRNSLTAPAIALLLLLCSAQALTRNVGKTQAMEPGTQARDAREVSWQEEEPGEDGPETVTVYATYGSMMCLVTTTREMDVTVYRVNAAGRRTRVYSYPHSTVRQERQPCL